MDWQPEQYERFACARLRPGLDLLARVPLSRARTMVDLGCGTGALFPALRARYPEARLTGVDSSPTMLAMARAGDAEVELIEADAATWRPESEVDLLFSNALLHWVPDHVALLPALLRSCRQLAAQVPVNLDAPSHRLIHELARAPRWRDRLGSLDLGRHVLTAAGYHALLRPHAATLDVWETTYWHALEGDDPVLDWVRGTTLLSVHRQLGGKGSAEVDAFEAEYGAALAAAYPPESDGRTLFPFKRLFVVAGR